MNDFGNPIRMVREQQRAYRKANKERLAEQQRAYYQANKERLAEKQRAYYQANKERLAEQQQCIVCGDKTRAAYSQYCNRCYIGSFRSYIQTMMQTIKVWPGLVSPYWHSKRVCPGAKLYA